jgi:hypothetical protein
MLLHEIKFNASTVHESFWFDWGDHWCGDWKFTKFSDQG